MSHADDESYANEVGWPELARREKWDRRFTNMAEGVSVWSKDPNRKVGAVLVSPDMRSVSFGYNGLPRGFPDDYKNLPLTPEQLLSISVHAEVNAVLNCPVPPTGWTLYCTTYPCAPCAAVIVQRLIGRIVCPGFARPESKWHESQKMASRLFGVAGIVTAKATP